MLKKVPNVFVIVFGLILAAGALTSLLLVGNYEQVERDVNDNRRTVVDPDPAPRIPMTHQEMGLRFCLSHTT